MRSAVLLLLSFVCILPQICDAQTSSDDGFRFTQVDLKLLEEANQLDHQFEKRGLVVNDPVVEAYLDRVSQPLLSSMPTPENVRWKIRVLRDPLVNAFALPNGSIYLNTGMLALVQNEAQLAGILGHELTHVRRRHSYLSYRGYRKKMVALHVISAAASWAPVGTAWGATIGIISMVSQGILVATVYGYSRELEREADAWSVDRLAVAGYDPMEVPETFKLLSEKLEPEPIQTFYRTHPKLEERIQYTTAMASNRNAGSRKGLSADDYMSTFEKLIRDDIQLEIDSRRFRTAVARAQRLVSFNASADNVFWLAESYRWLGARTPEPSAKEQTQDGMNDALKRLTKKTLEEEEKELLTKPEGPAAQKANRDKAEELFRQALQTDPACAKAYRGLGMLYEQQGRSLDAVICYQKYLTTAPNAPDRARIERRIETLMKTAQPAVT